MNSCKLLSPLKKSSAEPILLCALKPQRSGETIMVPKIFVVKSRCIGSFKKVINLFV